MRKTVQSTTGRQRPTPNDETCVYGLFELDVRTGKPSGKVLVRFQSESEAVAAAEGAYAVKPAPYAACYVDHEGRPLLDMGEPKDPVFTIAPMPVG